MANTITEHKMLALLHGFKLMKTTGICHVLFLKDIHSVINGCGRCLLVSGWSDVLHAASRGQASELHSLPFVLHNQPPPCEKFLGGQALGWLLEGTCSYGLFQNRPTQRWYQSCRCQIFGPCISPFSFTSYLVPVSHLLVLHLTWLLKPSVLVLSPHPTTVPPQFLHFYNKSNTLGVRWTNSWNSIVDFIAGWTLRHISSIRGMRAGDDLLWGLLPGGGLFSL